MKSAVHIHWAHPPQLSEGSNRDGRGGLMEPVSGQELEGMPRWQEGPAAMVQRLDTVVLHIR